MSSAFLPVTAFHAVASKRLSTFMDGAIGHDVYVEVDGRICVRPHAFRSSRFRQRIIESALPQADSDMTGMESRMMSSDNCVPSYPQ